MPPYTKARTFLWTDELAIVLWAHTNGDRLTRSAERAARQIVDLIRERGRIAHSENNLISRFDHVALSRLHQPVYNAPTIGGRRDPAGSERLDVKTEDGIGWLASALGPCPDVATSTAGGTADGMCDSPADRSALS